MFINNHHVGSCCVMIVYIMVLSELHYLFNTDRPHATNIMINMKYHPHINLKSSIAIHINYTKPSGDSDWFVSY